MPYIQNTPDDQQQMLETIGAKSIAELFAMVPQDVQLKRLLNLPGALSELELTRLMGEITARNTATIEAVSFLGAGCYDHFIPAAVDTLASHGNFVTAYTPYQAEASQGSLIAFFEYQTMIADLTGMDVSNASMYDGATACVEAVIMASSSGKRNRVIVPDTLHPETVETLRTYLTDLGLELVLLPTTGGKLDAAFLKAALDDRTSCVLVSHPNFFGNLEDVQAIGEIAHEAGALSIVSVDPISLGLLKRPVDYGADIVVSEGQSLGIPMNFGGPFLGIMACRESLLRKMPGRIVGQTVDRRGNRCWALTMQTREQHIRREKATSNICSNQGLMALRATIYLALAGPEGLKEAANLSLQKAHYLAEQLTQKTPLQFTFPNVPFFKEFAVTLPESVDADELLEQLANDGFFGGVSLGRWFPQHQQTLLMAVTEKRTKQEMDAFVAAMGRRL
ncbi:MAG: aminomethyl-transferring glycine dehydrogenase subunit GcvPA [Planctomycetaceae bacterium]|nr:aminomethyl-transferring glycine dehydrogenase subunit GcvPA [Planctomycetaceae bacterium]